jgi:hypothetical protein
MSGVLGRRRDRRGRHRRPRRPEHDDANYFLRFWIALAAGALVGIVVAVLLRERVWRFALSGGLGGIAFPSAVVGLLIFWLAAAETCID